MKAFKIWTMTVFWSTVVLVGGVVAINVVVDAYGILRTDFSRQFQLPNMNYVKISYLIRNTKKYDSLLFGSSRVENIDVKKIANGVYYNMTCPVGLPLEHLENIRFLVKSGMSIKNVMIGLDDFSYHLDPRQHRSDLELQPHPAVSGKKLQTFYGEYFLKLRTFMPQLAAYIRHNYTHRNAPEETRIIYDMYDTGRIFCPSCDADIERNVDAHIHSAIFNKPFHSEGDNMAKALAAMKEIAALAKQEHISLIVFINPIHKTTYLDTNLRQFALFKKELAAITDYYDFSGLNSVTTNNYDYYETSHYRPFVGDMMLKVMFGKPDVSAPRDFGFLVTRRNITSHLKNQCREIRMKRNDSAMNKVNTAFADSCERTGD
jgi:hypothetical protein